MSAAALRRLMASGEVVTRLATVERHKGESDWWETNDDGDLCVSVVLHNGETPLWAIVGAIVGGAGRGVWAIPPLGCEVFLGFEGGVEGVAYVLGAAGGAPDGLDPDKVVIVGLEVLIGPTPSELTELDGLVNGRAIDTFSGSTFFALGAASAKVKAAK